MRLIYIDLGGGQLEAPWAWTRTRLGLGPVFVWTCSAGGWTDLDVSFFWKPPKYRVFTIRPDTVVRQC